MQEHPNSRVISYPYTVATEFALVLGMMRVGARLMTVYELGLREGGTRRAVYTLAARKGYGGFESVASIRAMAYLNESHGVVHVGHRPYSTGDAAYFGHKVSFSEGSFVCEEDIAKWEEFLPPQTRLLLAFSVPKAPIEKAAL